MSSFQDSQYRDRSECHRSSDARLTRGATAQARVLALVALLVFSSVVRAAPDAPSTKPTTRFVTVDVFVDSPDAPLAAYQLDVRATDDAALVVGIEGGDGLFAKPPYYDPTALASGRVILAAFTTETAAASGRVRVARLHLRVPADGKTKFEIKVIVAADSAGRSVSATADVKPSPAATSRSVEGEKP